MSLQLPGITRLAFTLSSGYLLILYPLKTLVYSLPTQFGFSGSNQWKTRRDTLFATLHSNPKAPFVTRVVQFGVQPLFDQVLSPAQLTTQVIAAKQNLSDIGIPVTVSELAYGYQRNGGAQDVLDAIDSININMLPFFAARATTGMYLPLLSPRLSYHPLLIQYLTSPSRKPGMGKRSD